MDKLLRKKDPTKKGWYICFERGKKESFQIVYVTKDGYVKIPGCVNGTLLGDFNILYNYVWIKLSKKGIMNEFNK